MSQSNVPATQDDVKEVILQDKELHLNVNRVERFQTKIVQRKARIRSAKIETTRNGVSVTLPDIGKSAPTLFGSHLSDNVWTFPTIEAACAFLCGTFGKMGTIDEEHSVTTGVGRDLRPDLELIMDNTVEEGIDDLGDLEATTLENETETETANDTDEGTPEEGDAEPLDEEDNS